MGSAVSAFSTEQISSIANDILLECIGAFGAVDDYPSERVRQIAEKYIQVRGKPSCQVQTFSHVLFRHYKIKVDILHP